MGRNDKLSTWNLESEGKTVQKTQIPCQAEPGLFKGEFLVTFTTVDGTRSYFVDESVFHPDPSDQSTGKIDAWILGSSPGALVVSVPGQPADLKASRISIAA